MKLEQNQKLIYRVACVMTHDDKILLHRGEMDSFYALPGGSVEFGETSIEAIHREIHEELGATVETGNLLWVAENFFEYMNKDCHEIGLYYKAQFSGESRKYNSVDQFEGHEAHFVAGKTFKLYFKWFSADEIKNADIRPAFLKLALLDLPKQTQVVTNRAPVKPKANYEARSWISDQKDGL